MACWGAADGPETQNLQELSSEENLLVAAVAFLDFFIDKTIRIPADCLAEEDPMQLWLFKRSKMMSFIHMKQGPLILTSLLIKT